MGVLAAMGCRSEGLTGPEYGDPPAGGSHPGVGPTIDGGMSAPIADLAASHDLSTPAGACGDSKCNAATEVCVIEIAPLLDRAAQCRPVPTACGSLNARDCACLHSMCTGEFSTCVGANTPNTILCECPGCTP
jgi:hypothetical protein